MRTKGLFANLLDYGTLTLKTAGSTSNFDMTFCPKPMQCGRYINNIVDSYRDAHSFPASSEVVASPESIVQKKVKKIVS